MELAKTDALDRRIITILETNSRQSFSQLARSVRHGRDIVEYRVQRLQSLGIITRFSASINPYRFNKTIYKCYVKLKNAPKRVTDLIKALELNPHIYCMCLCDGAWDLIFTVIAGSAFEYNLVESSLLAQFKDIILGHSFGVILSYDCYSRRYLTGSEKGTHYSIGGEPAPTPIDEHDKQLLGELCKNSRISLSQLSSIIDLSVPSITSRINRLQSDTILTCFNLSLNMQKLGYSSYKAQLELISLDPETLAKVRKVCAKIPWITKLIVQLGNPRVECNLEAQGYEHFAEIIGELKQHLSEVVQSVSTMMIRVEKTFGLRELPVVYLDAAA